MAGAKQQVAAGSVLTALALTLLKVAAGLFTGSLRILAEAAHSGLHLVASLTTPPAGRLAHRAPDETHHYGHGRFENLAALFETLVLLGTCVWIISEAIDRLTTGGHHPDASIWAFGVMAISIGFTRRQALALARAAKEHDS